MFDLTVGVGTTSAAIDFAKDVFLGHDIRFALAGHLRSDFAGDVSFRDFEARLDGHAFFKDVFKNLAINYKVNNFNPFTKACDIAVTASANIHPIPYINAAAMNASTQVLLRDEEGVPGVFEPLKEPLHVMNITVVPQADPNVKTSVNATLTNYNVCARIAFKIPKKELLLDLKNIEGYISFKKEVFEINIPSVEKIRVPLPE